MRGRRGRGAAGGRRSDAQETKRSRLSAGPKAQAGGGIFKTAAVDVLRLERKLMTTGEITKVALDKGLIKCQGKTPEATMASALYTDVKRKHDKSVFTRPQEGLFGLREWINEGFFPEGWVGPTDGLGLAPFKKRNSSYVKGNRTSGRSTRTRTARDASSDLDEGEFDTMEDEEDEAETEEMMDEDELVEEDSPRPHRGARGRGRGRDLGAGGSRTTTTTRSVDVPSGGFTGRGSRAPPDTHDALESPLHILGEVAEMTQGPDGGLEGLHSVGGTPPPPSSGSGKRKRRPSNLQLPEGAGGGDEVLMPRSPLDDSLAALHEIATSPSTYAPALMDSSSKRRPRPSLGLGDLASSLVPNIGRQSSLVSPHMLLHGLDSSLSPLLTDHGAMLLSGPDTSKSPLVNLNIPSLSGSQLLDTSGLLPLQLPDTLPTTPDMLAAAIGKAGLASLISPGWTPRPPMDAAAALAGRLGSRRASEGLASLLQLSGAASLQGSMAPSLLAPLLSAQGPGMGGLAASGPAGARPLAAAPPPRTRQYGGLTPQQAAEDMVEIRRMKAVVERLEARMGRGNPQVGKAWLSVARMYQHVGGSMPEVQAQAAEALARARAVCKQFCSEHKCTASTACEEGFEYLTGRMTGTGAGRGTGGAHVGASGAAGTAAPDAQAGPAQQQQQGQGEHLERTQTRQQEEQQQQQEGQHKTVQPPDRPAPDNLNGLSSQPPASAVQEPQLPQLQEEPTLSFDLRHSAPPSRAPAAAPEAAASVALRTAA